MQPLPGHEQRRSAGEVLEHLAVRGSLHCGGKVHLFYRDVFDGVQVLFAYLAQPGGQKQVCTIR